jgi:fructokinase
LQDVGLDTTHIALDGEHPTGTVSVKLNRQGKPEYLIHEGVAWDFIPSDSSLEALADKADAVCFGSLCQRSAMSRDAVRKFLEATRPDCIRIFDINLRQSYYSRAVIDDMLRRSDVLKLNDEELSVVAHVLEMRGDNEEVLRELRQRYGLKLIVLTLGADGSKLLTSERVSSCRIEEPITIADTVGAGDAFTAVVSMGLLQRWDLDKINKAANRLAAFVCTRKGAMPPVPQTILQDLPG